jgi:hypothetical protein
MSNELFAAVRSAHDDLPTIKDALLQWVLRHDWYVEIPSHVHAPPELASPLISEILEYKICWLLGWGLRDTSIIDATVTAILRVLVVKNSPPPLMLLIHSRESLLAKHAQVLQEWARLQACLAQWQALQSEHCPLIAPL